MVFTGLVQQVGQATFDRDTNKIYVTVSEPNYFAAAKQGDSIAINGVCLTILEPTQTDTAVFFVMEETRRKTNLVEITKGTPVNVEHALRIGDSMGGHSVSGHVDGVARVVSITDRSDGSRDVWVDLSGFDPTMVHVVYKGSVCLDGVSLTVAELNHNSTQLRVSLIPHTQTHTNLQFRKTGDHINVEFDQALRALRAASSSGASSRPKVPTTAWERQLVDEHFMHEAILLGERGRISAPPNPWVASVIVDTEGEIIGSGYHQKAGEPHAEVLAVRDAVAKGNEAKLAGSTIYVTLEPCHHVGRTPPCDQLLISTKFARAVVALEDPDIRVRGQGVAALRAAGITVDVGVLASEARASLSSYLHHRANKRPYVVAKVAISIDGKIGCADGTSQWITGEAARADAHLLRAQSQAIIVGSETAVKDKPRLNVRLGASARVGVIEDPTPLRVVLDGRGRVVEGPLLDKSVGPTLIVTTKAAPEASRTAWTAAGVEVFELEETNSKQQCISILEELGRRGILQVMVEGGASVQSNLLSYGLVDKLVVYQGSCILGNTGRSWSQVPLAETIAKAGFWKLQSVAQFDNDIRSVYEQ